MQKPITKHSSHSVGRLSTNGLNLLSGGGGLKAVSIKKLDFSKSFEKRNFYIENEVRLQRLLREASALKGGPSVERLCVFRDVFDILISSFKTYQPILSLIKNEYEDIIMKYRNDAKLLGPAQEMLYTVVNDYEARLSVNVYHQVEETKSLKKWVLLLERKIKKMREEEEANKITQEKLCEKLKNLSDDLLRESDSRKLALLDLNQLRTEYSDLLKYNKELSRQTQEGGDSITLKIALERAKEAHKLALEKITYLETAYVNVVPKEEFSNVQDRLADSESENERLRANCEQLRSQLENISKDLAVVTSEKEEIADRYAVLRKTSTPRPEWSCVGGMVPGGRRHWQQLTSGKSSKEKLAILTAELAGDSALTLPGLDIQNETNKKVPKFIEDLTHTYPRLLPKRDLLILLEDFWSKRQEQLNDFLKCLRDNVQSTLPSFNDFLYKYLKEAFGIEKIRREWSLSLYISGRVMTDCEELVRFRMVADNEIDEAYHWYLRSLTGRLFNQLREIAHATAIAFSMTTEPTGEKVTDVQLAKPKRSDCQLSVRQLSVVLAKLLQCTPDHESITRLIKIAFTNDDIDDSETTLQTGISMDATVSLEELFYRGPGEPTPPFVIALVNRLVQGRKPIIDHILMEIQRQKSNDADTVMVKPFEVAEAMKSVRPELEKIITSSPTCFFRLEESPQENEEGRRGSSRILSETDSLVCDLDETSATREEQALAWARCPNGQAKNYLNATINWMFQGEETQKATTNALPTIPMELLERRLRGANIKPSN